MKVLVDTDVWSEALRRSGPKSPWVAELRLLVEEGRVQMIGLIRYEILCGIRDEHRFRDLAARLEAFPDRPLESEIHVLAARYFHLCRSRGIQGSTTDLLLCACSTHWRVPLLTKDRDFLAYRDVLPIALAEPRGGA